MSKSFALFVLVSLFQLFINEKVYPAVNELKILPENHFQEKTGSLPSSDSLDLNEIGTQHLYNGNYDSAIFILTKALKNAVHDIETYHVIQNNLGITYWSQGEFSKSLVHLESCTKFWESSAYYEHLPAAYLNLSLVWGEVGEMGKAKDYVDLAEKYYYQNKQEDPSTLSYILIQQGVIFNDTGQFEEALKFFKKAYLTSLNNLNETDPIFELHYKNFAVVYPEIDMLDSARYYSIKSIEFIENSASKAKLYFSYEIIGSIYRKEGNIDLALNNYLKAIDLLEKRSDAQHPDLIIIYNSIGELFLENDQPEKALHYFRLGNNISQLHVSDEEMAKGNDGSLGNRLVNNYYGIVKSLRMMCLRTGEDVECSDIEGVFVQLFNFLKHRSFKARNKDDRESIGIFNDILLDHIEWVLSAEINTEEKKKKIFQLIEFYKGFEMKKALILSQYSFSNSQNSLRYREIKKLDSLESRLKSFSLDSGDQRAFDLLKISRGKDSLFMAMGSDLSTTIVSRDDDFSLSKLQKSLNEEEALLYFIPNHLDKVMLFFISKNDSEIVKTELKIAQIVNEISAANKIYPYIQSFIADKSNIGQLVILPFRGLWNINFDLLLTDENNLDSYLDMSYLIKKYSIRYAYSTSAMLQESTATKRANKTLLAFSYAEHNTFQGGQISLKALRSQKKELPGSVIEVKTISNELNGDYVYGNQSSERLFKSIANEYKILHLAIHGEINDDEPQNSKLYFYAAGDTLEDGKLHAFELNSMKLNAELAVLSACNSGAGKIIDGEGLMSLGRAFAHAGVESLLLTREKISDVISPRLMQLFYQELKKGKRKSEALRAAKLIFLDEADEITSDPFYWSSYYILGNDSPINFQEDQKRFSWVIFLIAALLMFAILLIGIRKKRLFRLTN